MIRASRGRLGRTALAVLGLLALLVAGAVGARAQAHESAPATTIVAQAHCCAPGGHGPHDHDRNSGEARHAGCAVACVTGAIASAAPTILGADMAALAWPTPTATIAGRSTRPEPEPPRRATRA